MSIPIPKWTKYGILRKKGLVSYWPLLVNLGKGRVLAKLGQNGPSTELAGFKYQAQNIFFFISVQSSKTERISLFPKLFFFHMTQGSYEKKRKKNVQDRLLENTWV